MKTPQNPMVRFGLGCMRLSGEEVDPGRAIEVIHAALDAGMGLLDTANVYAPNDREIGHNERLVARALACWSGNREHVSIATKGGLTRPGGRWVPDGRAASLRRSCQSSRETLGVDCIDLYLLHAPDPRVPITTSARALGKLKKDGLVRRVGLCNVSLAQLKAAREVTEVDAVQVSLHLLDESALRGGVAEYCAENQIELIAHSPLGGADRVQRMARQKPLAVVAQRHDVTPAEMALAWLLDLHPCLRPIPGATRVETIASIERAASVQLSADERAELEHTYPAGGFLRGPRELRKPEPRSDAEVVLLMGSPASGKSSLVPEYEQAGSLRLNRDDQGGRLADLIPLLDSALKDGQKRVVLDNTYPTRRSRNEVIETAWQHDVPVRCVWRTTSIADAQINAVTRMLDRHDRLLEPDEIRSEGRATPNTFGPDALFRFERGFEPPELDEGFASLEQIPFERHWGEGFDNAALFLDVEDVLCPSKPTSDRVELLPGRAERVREWAEEGGSVLLMTWLPEVGKGKLSPTTVDAFRDQLITELGVDLGFAYCPHGAGPPVCWCRKPLPGLAVSFVREHRLEPARCTLVGRSTADRTLAERMGFQHVPAEEFFTARR